MVYMYIIKPVENPKRDYLAYLTWLNYDKGIDLAIKLSLFQGHKLKIAGIVGDSEEVSKLLFKESITIFG